MDWDLSGYFDTFEGPGYRVFRETLGRDLQALAAELAAASPLSEGSVEEWARLIGDYENLARRLSHLRSYLACLASADAADERYAAAEASLGETGAEFAKLGQTLERALGAAANEFFEALCAHPEMEQAGYALGRMREDAKRRMSPDEEALAADLRVNGMGAWSRLYFQLAGTLRFSLAQPEGGTREVPMAQRMTLLADPDRAVRRAAMEGSNATWKTHELTAAAALNALAGTRHTLFRRRGIGHFLDEAARASRVDRRTLEALLEAIESERPLARALLSERMRILGVTDPGFHDLHAPLPSGDAEPLSWETGTELVLESFGAAYPALADFMRELVEKRWIDHSPREAKRPGGFCTSSSLSRESRVFMTFAGTMNEVMTLAHEAGHAWHNRVLRPRRALAASYPMTLAESASTFAEMILSAGVLADERFSPARKRQILDADTERALAFLLDIPMRFRFEEALYAERSRGVLSPRRLCELMVEKQRESYGETLVAGGEDPFFWASKLHFYIEGTFFYNYPYSFGYLLSLSLFARFQAEGASFLPAYEAFLADTGRMDCAEVVRHNLGEDIGEPAFWRRAIRSLEPSLEALRAW
jgi:oligoendopeptidase F